MELAFESSPVTTALTLFYKAVKAVWRLFTDEELAFDASPIMFRLHIASHTKSLIEAPPGSVL